MKLLESLKKRNCPICNSNDVSKVKYVQNIDESRLDNLAFSSRKTPEFMNLEMVQCPKCSLLYAPRVPNAALLDTAYNSTGYESNEEAIFAANTYAEYLQQNLGLLVDRESALEIGSGNGAFIKHLLNLKFKKIIGIEPSIEAVAAAPDSIKEYLRAEMFKPGNFKENEFSLITIFQTLEHIDEPGQFFTDAYRLLKPGGVLMVVSHNCEHWLMRLLGSKSPIIDIEHLQLFSPESLKYSLQIAGFKLTQISSLKNTYPLHYWVKLLPIPNKIKSSILESMKNGLLASVGGKTISANVGNMVAFAKKI